MLIISTLKCWANSMQLQHCNQGPQAHCQDGDVSRPWRLCALPTQHTWLTICFCRPSNLSSVLSSLSVLPLNKSKIKSITHHPGAILQPECLPENPLNHWPKGKLVDPFAHRPQNLAFSQCHNFYRRGPPLSWDYSMRWSTQTSSEASCSTVILSQTGSWLPIESYLNVGL